MDNTFEDLEGKVYNIRHFKGVKFTTDILTKKQSNYFAVSDLYGPVIISKHYYDILKDHFETNDKEN